MNIKAPTEPEYNDNVGEYCATLFLALLLFADLLFIILHLVHSITPLLNSWFYSLSWYKSYAEVYQYLKWLWIIFLLVNLSRLRRSFSYMAWVLVVIFFLCTDVLSIHNIFGRYLADKLPLLFSFELSAQDLGVLIASIVASMFLPSLIGYTYYRGSQAFKKISRDMLLLVLGLIFFGIFIDMIHDLESSGRRAYFILETIENSGETLVVSLILWYSFLVSIRSDNNNASLCQLLSGSLLKLVP